MVNMILTTHVQVNSRATAELFAKMLAKTTPLAAELAVDVSEEHDARILLGETSLATHDGKFKSNAA